MIRKIQLTAAVVAAVFAGSTLAEGTPEQIKEIGITGTKYTPSGAERAGNKEGTIPAWNDNEGVKPPASYDLKHMGHMPNPWPNEKPLYSITAQNMDKYLDKIAEPERAMLKKYPDFRMDVYPTHRISRYPQHYMENSVKNAKQCKSDNSVPAELVNCLPGIPFPFPKTGEEVVWNHNLSIRYMREAGDHVGLLVDASGTLQIVGKNGFYSIQPAFFVANKDKVMTKNDVYWAYRQFQTYPPRQAGEMNMIIDRVSAANNRKAWVYIPGQRRVKLAPDIAFDTPLPQGGSAAVYDDVYTFFGSPEKYEWKLIGKQEKYIWANVFKIQDPKDCPIAKLIHKGFPNPDCIRYELRRTWVVEATLKPGMRHIYAKRIFYWDEDNLFEAGTGFSWDAAGKPYRVSHATGSASYNMSQYNLPVELSFGTPSAFLNIDMVNGSWLFSGQNADAKFGWGAGNPTPDMGLPVVGPVDMKNFTPESMAADGVR